MTTAHPAMARRTRGTRTPTAVAVIVAMIAAMLGVAAINASDAGAVPTVLYRVNVGGPQLDAADLSLPAWAEDTNTNPSAFRVGAGGDNIFLGTSPSAYQPIVTTDTSLRPGDPTDVFNAERWDPPAAPEMLWQFPIDPGTEVEVRLLFAELFNGITAAGQRIFDVSVEGSVPGDFIDIDPFAYAGAAGAFAVTTTLTVNDGTLDLEFLHDIENPALKGIEITALSSTPPAEVLVQVTPGGTLDASTFGAGSMSITHTGVAGSPDITSVELDLRGSLIPDATFDPTGAAGDATAKCLEIAAGAADTGYVTPGDPCVDPYGVPHDGGFDTMVLNFTDFNPGETITFATDIDPTTIQGSGGSGGAGSVSGLELAGSPVQATLAGGSTLSGQLFGDGSQGGAAAYLSPAVGQVQPTGIDMLGVTATPTVFPNSRGGNVAATGNQTVRVSGPVGAAVTLLEVAGAIPATGFDLDPFESDTATSVAYPTATIGAGGFADFTVNVADANSLYHYVAAIDDGGQFGLLSDILVIGVGGSPPVGGTVYAAINAGGPTQPAVNGGPAWDADTTGANHPYLTNAGSNNQSGFAATEPGPTVPDTVNPAIFDTERYSTSGFSYGVPVPAGTQVYVRLYLGNGFPGTSSAGQRVFDVTIDGAIVEDDLDLIPTFGHEVGGMLEYLVTSDGVVDVAFINNVENPLLNGLEVVSAESAPGELAASPTALDFGTTLVNGSSTLGVTLTNLGFEAGDPDIDVTSVTTTGGEFSTNFAGPVTLGPGVTTSFDVTFAPTSVGAQAGTVEIAHTGTNTPLVLDVSGTGSSDIPVSFSSDGLVGESSSNPTSLQFGPDGRLYVAQQNGLIYAYDVQRNGPGDYVVTSTEQIDVVKNGTPNHNDDGAENATTNRQVTGLLVSGTAANPVLYVTSSDWRISVGNDVGLDTNSGVVSRLTWNGSTWDKVDIVRGLPRSEENHSTNGMALDEGTNTLYLMQGGHANKGAPSNNFSGTPEYYLSAAMLSIDLDAINALPTYTDPRNGADFVYDLRTLDDPSRANIDNTSGDFPYPAGHPLYGSTIDPGDPFGGNNGQNQAIPEPGGPVQIYSPGYRNAYDVVLTQNGRLYTFDNGPNGGWGGLPLIYDAAGTPKGTGPFDQGAGDYCTNEFNESGSDSHGDTLHFVSAPGYYGGHPTPSRAFPTESRIIVYEEIGSTWTDVGNFNFDDLLPAGLSPGDFPDNPIECSYTSNDPAKYLDIINASTNGLAEYTADNFGGALQGNLLAASFNGNIYRYALNAAGDAFDEKEALFSGFGSQPLDVTALDDDGPFPGTIWAATYGSDNITVFEPADYGSTPPPVCTGADDPLLDEDEDNYDNADEIDNGTNPCSAASVPDDNDGDFVSDLNDDDDDNDSILDVNDAFAIDPDNGLTTNLPVLRPLWNDDPGTGFFGIGVTGLMSNGATDYLDQFDPDFLAAGGAGGKLTVEGVPAGDAFTGTNTQEYAFQYGINADTTTLPFRVNTAVESPFFGGVTPTNFQSLGMFIGTGDQDNYLKMVLNANGGTAGVQVLLESAGAVTSDSQYDPTDLGVADTAALLGAGAVDLFIDVDPAALTAQPLVSVDGAPPVSLGSPIAIPASWLSPSDAQGLAVGFISTSNGPGDPFDASWDYLDVTLIGANPPGITPVADVSIDEGANDSIIVEITDIDEDALTIDVNSVPDGSSFITETLVENGPGDYTLTLDLAPLAGDAGTYTVTVSADDGLNTPTLETFDIEVIPPAPPAEVLVEITPGQTLPATTFGNASITVTHNGPAGSALIDSVTLDLRGSLVPDATFDPNGDAGDAGSQCLAVSNEGGTGFVTPADPCIDPFSLPHEDAPGVPGNGDDGLTLDFTDFGPGESIVFGVDVDPTTIQGVPATGGAGAVSGLELSGSGVSASLNDATVLTGQLFGDGSAGGGAALLSSVTGQDQPTSIEMLGVTTVPTVFPNNSIVGGVPATGPQTVRVSGTVGADVTLLQVDGAYPNPIAFDLDPFETDEATAVTYATGTIGAGGFVDFPVNVADADTLYHYVAAIDDGSLGLLSQILVIAVGAPAIDPIDDVTVDEGDPVNISVNATDSSPLSLSIISTPDIEALGAVFVDGGDGTATLDWTTEPGDAGVYQVEITADDGTLTTTETFTITVEEVLPVVQPGAGFVFEGNSGEVTLEVPVTLSAESDDTVTVEWRTINGLGPPANPTDGVDFEAATGILTFLPGETSKTVPVTVYGDTLDEVGTVFNAEWGGVIFENPVNATLPGGLYGRVGWALIVDDDDPPIITPESGFVIEGASGTTTELEVSASLSAPSGNPVTVDWATVDTLDQPQAGVDYIAAAGTITFEPGETTKTVSFTVIGDDEVEPGLVNNAEWGLVSFTNPTLATLPDGPLGAIAFALIVDDD